MLKLEKISKEEAMELLNPKVDKIENLDELNLDFDNPLELAFLNQDGKLIVVNKSGEAIQCDFNI